MAGDAEKGKPVVLVHRLPVFSLSFGDRLRQHFSVLDPVVAPSAADLRRFLGPRASEIRAVLCHGPSPLNAETLACLPSLECVVGSAAGVDHIDLAECHRRGIAVANNGGAFSQDAADYAVGLLIDVLRRISAADRYVRAKSWPQLGDFHLGSKLGGKRVGIVGLGSIGSLVAKRLTALGCSIMYSSRKKKVSAPYIYCKSVHELALESEVLVLCCSLTDQTRHIVNSSVMSALGPQGVVINIGRGAVIDEKEMVRFLVEGKLKGVGLDVFEDEPNVPKELLGLENVVLSPHQGILTPESFKASEDMVVANLQAFFETKSLLSPVSLV